MDTRESTDANNMYTTRTYKQCNAGWYANWDGARFYVVVVGVSVWMYGLAYFSLEIYKIRRQTEYQIQFELTKVNQLNLA